MYAINNAKLAGGMGSVTTAVRKDISENLVYNFQARLYVGIDDGCKLDRISVEVKSASFVVVGDMVHGLVPPV